MTSRYEGKKVQWDKLYGGLGLGREREGEGKGRGGLEYVVLTHCQREEGKGREEQDREEGERKWVGGKGKRGSSLTFNVKMAVCTASSNSRSSLYLQEVAVSHTHFSLPPLSCHPSLPPPPLPPSLPPSSPPSLPPSLILYLLPPLARPPSLPPSLFVTHEHINTKR